jgi:hypothetical protein
MKTRRLSVLALRVQSHRYSPNIQNHVILRQLPQTPFMRMRKRVQSCEKERL